MNQDELVMISLNQLVPENHQYRKFKSVWNLKPIEKILAPLQPNGKFEGFGIVKIFLCLLIQFMEDLSDRELERFICENNAARWFAKFKLLDKTPDHTVFCKARKKIGTKILSDIFANLRNQLKSRGLINETFSFIDATHLISKSQLWEERDKAIAQKYEKLNNTNVSKFSADREARFGCKGSTKFWYGYKKQISVDMQSGLINKVAIRPANEPDANGLKNVCPSFGAVYADKGYCTKKSQAAAAKKMVHLAAIKKNNMKGKIFDLDKFYSHIRAPYERIFSKESKRVKYKGLVKNQFAAFMQAICLNAKRLITLLDPCHMKLIVR